MLSHMNTHPHRRWLALLTAVTLSACAATESGGPTVGVDPDAAPGIDAAAPGGAGGQGTRADAAASGGAAGGTRADAAASGGAAGEIPPDAAVAVLDMDDDGVPDAVDNCPTAANHGQDDTDEDGVGDVCDLCPATADPAQADTDGDGRGDACDVSGDDDGDEIGDVVDNCPLVANTDQADADDDGVGTACDLCPGVADPAQADTDGDGLGDVCDVCPDAPVSEDDHADVDGDGVPACAGDCDDLDRDRAPGVPERCNLRDDDCDGAVDEAFPQLGARCSAGVGLCNEAGLFACGPDGVVCNAAPHPPRDEVCNGLDDDCDGETDEGSADCCVPGEARACGVETGACAAGTQLCGAARSWGGCEGAVGPGVEACNGVDDDCDGLTDEDQGTVSCGVGACAHEAAACVGGQVVACDPFVGALAEACNGLDDDCDGVVDDEAAGTGVACTAGIGACARAGTTVCSDGGVLCDAVAGAPVAESCNGLDDDCDGVVDDDTCGGNGSCADPYVVPAEGQEATFQIAQTNSVRPLCGAPADGVDQVHWWTAPRSGVATFRAVTDYWPAFMAVGDGGCNGGNPACSYEAGQWPTNRVQLQVVAGTTYTIMLGHGRYDGPIVLTYTLTVTPPP